MHIFSAAMHHGKDVGPLESYKVVHCKYPENTPVFPYPERGKGAFYWCSGKMHNYYVRINAALDIETTKLETGGAVLSVPYVITICLSSPYSPIRFLYECKNWADVQELLDKISEFYGLGYKKWDKKERRWVDSSTSYRRLLCFIHNASFEFAFMRTELKFSHDEYSFFCKEKRSVITATLENGVEFRDSMALTNSSLEQLAKMYTKTRKMKGDLDYKIPRHTHTKRTKKEQKYIDNDVLVLAEFCDVYFDKMCHPNKRPPLTNTARLLLKVVERAEESGLYREDVTKLMPDVTTLKRWQKYLFRGGYVHGNIYYINTIVNVLMRDITSSYPGSMFMSYYPIDRFVNAKIPTAWKYGEMPDIVREHLEKHCCIYEATFYGLRAKTDHSYESLNKVIDWLPMEEDILNGTKGLDNGRIHRAEYVRVMGTELDYEIYEMLYEWDAVEIHSFQIATRGQLPDYLLSCLAEDYKRKNDLKVHGLSHTTDYALAKVDVNTYFGMLCKSIFSVNISYDYDLNEWVERACPDEEIEKDLAKRWLAYQWGIYVCAHSRVKLVRMICEVEKAGGHVIYYDTDSIKYIPSGDGKTEEVFELENKRIREERKKYPLLRDNAFGGKMGKGLGEWDAEILDSLGRPLICPFKTLGAKRYLYHQPDGEWSYTAQKGWYKEGVGWHLCVAGLPKCAVEKLPGDPFKFFSSSGFKFTGEETGKLRPVYHDEPYELTITDRDGTTETIKAKSGVSLVETDFEITEKKLALLILSKVKYKEERYGRAG